MLWYCPVPIFMGIIHGLACPLDDQRNNFRWFITNFPFGVRWPTIWSEFESRFLILILNLIRSRYHLLLSFCFCPDDHYCWRWCLQVLSLKRKNILLAGIVNPANFKSKEVYSLFTQLLRHETINQSNLQFFTIFHLVRFLLLWSKGGCKAVMGSFHQTKSGDAQLFLLVNMA